MEMVSIHWKLWKATRRTGWFGDGRSQGKTMAVPGALTDSGMSESRPDCAATTTQSSLLALLRKGRLADKGHSERGASEVFHLFAIFHISTVLSSSQKTHENPDTLPRPQTSVAMWQVSSICFCFQKFEKKHFTESKEFVRVLEWKVFFGL